MHGSAPLIALPAWQQRALIEIKQDQARTHGNFLRFHVIKPIDLRQFGFARKSS
jgi:hypothetical protein